MKISHVLAVTGAAIPPKLGPWPSSCDGGRCLGVKNPRCRGGGRDFLAFSTPERTVSPFFAKIWPVAALPSWFLCCAASKQAPVDSFRCCWGFFASVCCLALQFLPLFFTVFFLFFLANLWESLGELRWRLVLISASRARACRRGRVYV